MKELKNILAKYEEAKDKSKLALATVVRVEGSSYRRTGARMLVADDGTWVGGISGGCLEGDALKRARLAILKSTPSLITYDTTIDDDHQIGVGLGCNGVIDVLFVPINSQDTNNPIEKLKQIANSNHDQKIAITVCNPPEIGLLWGNILASSDLAALESLAGFENVPTLIATIQQTEKSRNIMFKNGLQLFVELIPKPIHVFLLGHQYDLYALSDIIRGLSWSLNIVADPLKVRASERSLCIHPETFNPELLDENAAVVLMSHSLQTDKNNLLAIKDSKAGYVGMLGPKVRSERIFEELHAENHTFSDEFMTKVFAPVGLDIGAETPDEIALSIVAEIKAVFSNRSGASLRNRLSPINDRDQPMYFN